MKRTVILLVVIFASASIGYFVGKGELSLKAAPTIDPRILKEINEKCSTADKKEKIYFKKYGAQKNAQEPVNNEEWVDAQSWEQACTEAIEALRSQYSGEK